MTKNRVDGSMDGAMTLSTRTRINNNLPDLGFLATQTDFTTSTTLTDLAGCVTGNLNVGTYRFTMDVDVTATANGGVKFALKQNNGLTLSSMRAKVIAMSASAVAVTAFTSTTDVASIYAATAATILVRVVGMFVVSAEGTLSLQAAQNASHADTTSYFAGTNFQITRVGN